MKEILLFLEKLTPNKRMNGTNNRINDVINYGEGDSPKKLEGILQQYKESLGDCINMSDGHKIKDLKITVPISVNIFDVISENQELFNENQDLYDQYIKVLKVFGFLTLRSLAIHSFHIGDHDNFDNFLKITGYFQYYSQMFPDVDLRDLVIIIHTKIGRNENIILDNISVFISDNDYEKYSKMVSKVIFSYKYFGIQTRLTHLSESNYYIGNFLKLISNKDTIFSLNPEQLEVELKQYNKNMIALKEKYPEENFKECEICLQEIEKICAIKQEVEDILNGKRKTLTKIDESHGINAYSYFIGARTNLAKNNKGNL